MKENIFQGKKVTVMGIGLHGGAVDLILWLLQRGAKVTATDKKSDKQLAKSLKMLEGKKNLKLVIGQHRMEDFQRADLVIKNPAVPWSNPYAQAALKNKVPVEMDSSLFFQFCPSQKIIGVTGTKGKTTTATLIYQILKEAGKKPIKVGIGQGAVMSRLEKIKSGAPVVFELSSWRLSALRRKKVSPAYAVVVNIFPDHLNYYSSMEKYIQDKKAVLENQKSSGKLVLNYDQAVTQSLAKEAKGMVAYFSKQKQAEERVVFLEEGWIRYHWAGEEGRIAQVEELKLRGRHNLNNVLAACSLTLLYGIAPKIVRRAIKKFEGLPHRLEFVATKDEVKYYNDTAATTPESGVAGIEAFQEELMLIAGGSNKNLELEPLAKKITEAENVKKVFLLKGEATDRLAKMIGELGGEHKLSGTYESMEAAVNAAKNEAQAGQVVLLSPGCASFGLFENEFDRGEKFRQAVEGLIN